MTLTIAPIPDPALVDTRLALEAGGIDPSSVPQHLTAPAATALKAKADGAAQDPVEDEEASETPEQEQAELDALAALHEPAPVVETVVLDPSAVEPTHGPGTTPVGVAVAAQPPSVEPVVVEPLAAEPVVDPIADPVDDPIADPVVEAAPAEPAAPPAVVDASAAARAAIAAAADARQAAAEARAAADAAQAAADRAQAAADQAAVAADQAAASADQAARDAQAAVDAATPEPPAAETPTLVAGIAPICEMPAAAPIL